ncbi:MAG: hypothetical protein M9932_01185 [Xanthobacteraceae bacterium]|nr:hypothetical protein [Xanthobacteraceae bacterium]
MRKEPMLATAPAPIASLPAFYAVAFHQAEHAVRHYGAAARVAHDSDATDSEATASVFESLAAREAARAEAIAAACVAACGAPPDLKNLPATFADVVPAQEADDVARSSLATPYAAWALAVLHRRRAFIYWTYVAALAGNATVSAAAERLAREALADGNELRRSRRLAWQSEHQPAAEDRAGDRDASAALLESLLRRDVIAWSQTLPPAEGRRLLDVGVPGFVQHGATASESENIETPRPNEIERVKQRALRRAEQLSNAYLDEADRAKDQSSLEFAQELATQSIARLAGLRAVASSSGKQARPASS